MSHHWCWWKGEPGHSGDQTLTVLRGRGPPYSKFSTTLVRTLVFSPVTHKSWYSPAASLQLPLFTQEKSVRIWVRVSDSYRITCMNEDIWKVRESQTSYRSAASRLSTDSMLWRGSTGIQTRCPRAQLVASTESTVFLYWAGFKAESSSHKYILHRPSCEGGSESGSIQNKQYHSCYTNKCFMKAALY